MTGRIKIDQTFIDELLFLKFYLYNSNLNNCLDTVILWQNLSGILLLNFVFTNNNFVNKFWQRSPIYRSIGNLAKLITFVLYAPSLLSWILILLKVLKKDTQPNSKTLFLPWLWSFLRNAMEKSQGQFNFLKFFTVKMKLYTKYIDLNLLLIFPNWASITGSTISKYQLGRSLDLLLSKDRSWHWKFLWWQEYCFSKKRICRRFVLLGFCGLTWRKEYIAELHYTWCFRGLRWSLKGCLALRD